MNAIGLKSLGRSLARTARRARIPPWSTLFLVAVLTGAGFLILPGSLKPNEEARRALGGALLAVGLVGILHDHLFVRRVIGNYFELLKTAASLELDELYVDRSDALRNITQELDRASGNVKISCVSGSDFFRDGPAAKAIDDLVERRANVHLRFLLLKPTSRYAYLRAWLEETYNLPMEDQLHLDEGELRPNYSRAQFRESTMQGRLEAARIGLLQIKRTLQEPTKLTVRYTTYPPALFLVAVNRWIFVEPYHWGVDPDYRPGVAPCIGKSVCVLRFRRNSLNGSIFENHFDRLWRCANTERWSLK